MERFINSEHQEVSLLNPCYHLSVLQPGIGIGRDVSLIGKLSLLQSFFPENSASQSQGLVQKMTEIERATFLSHQQQFGKVEL